MSHDMFEDVVHPSVRVGTKRWHAVSGRLELELFL